MHFDPRSSGQSAPASKAGDWAGIATSFVRQWTRYRQFNEIGFELNNSGCQVIIPRIKFYQTPLSNWRGAFVFYALSLLKTLESTTDVWKGPYVPLAWWFFIMGCVIE